MIYMKTLERKIIENSATSVKKTLDDSLPDLSNHPVVLKKVAEAREHLKKTPHL